MFELFVKKVFFFTKKYIVISLSIITAILTIHSAYNIIYDSEYAKKQLIIGKSYMANGDVENALKKFEKSYKIDGNVLDVRMELAYVYCIKNKYKNAKKYWLKVMIS